LKPVGAALAKEYGKRLLRMKEATWLPKVRAKAVSMMMDLIRDDLAALGITHEVFFPERSLFEGETDQVQPEELRLGSCVWAAFPAEQTPEG
jgi:arginyl-tRNA synthetase